MKGKTWGISERCYIWSNGIIKYSPNSAAKEGSHIFFKSILWMIEVWLQIEQGIKNKKGACGRFVPGHSFSAWGCLRKVLKAGSGADAPPSTTLPLLHNSHTHSQKLKLGRFLTYFPWSQNRKVPSVLTRTRRKTGLSWKDTMDMWRTLLLTWTLLLNLCLHIEAQALGEFHRSFIDWYLSFFKII